MKYLPVTVHVCWIHDRLQGLREPALRERIVASDNLPFDGSRAEFARRIAQEWAGNRRLGVAGMRME